MKRREGRMMFDFSGTLKRAVLISCLLSVLVSGSLLASGSHEAEVVANGTGFSGQDVFRIQADGSVPFLRNDEFFIPRYEPGFEPYEDLLRPAEPAPVIEEPVTVETPATDVIEEVVEKAVRDKASIVLTSTDVFGAPIAVPAPVPVPAAVPVAAPEKTDPVPEIKEELPPVIEEPVFEETVTEDEPLYAEEEEDLWAEEDDLWDEDGLWAEDDDLWGEDPWGDDFWEEEWEPADLAVDKDALMEDDADFWADFYIAGEEAEMELPDGSYYMDLYINDQFRGNVEIVSSEGVTGVDAESFRYATSDMTNDEEKQYLSSFTSTVPFSDLEVRGYETEVDNIGYVVTMYMPTSALDTVVLSIANGGLRGSGFYASRPLSNSIEVDNTVFNLETSYSLSMYVPLWPDFDAWNLLNMDISMSNRARIADVYNQFSFGMSFGRDRFSFRTGLYSFYTDFPSEGLRLSWGNISGYGRPSKGTPLGLKLEKNASYYDQSWKKESYITKELVLEEKSDIYVMNDGKETFQATLEMGTYRLEDFVLSSGNNDVRIIVKPLDGSPERTIDFSVLYGYSLLAPGENWWGVSLLTGREMKNSKSPSGFALDIPYLNDTFIEYDARNFSLGFFYDFGLCRGLTVRTRGSFTNNPTDTVSWKPTFRLDSTFISTTDLGGLTFSAAYWNAYGEGDIETHFANAGWSQSFATGLSQLSSISLSLSYDLKANPAIDAVSHTGRGALSTGGRLGFLNWSLSLSGTVGSTNDLLSWSYAGSTSVSFSAGRHVSVSASASLSDTDRSEPNISLRMGLSMYFGGVSSSASADGNGNLDFRVSGGKGRHSASGSISTNFLSGWGTGLSAYYSYFGNYVNVSSGLSASIDWMDEKRKFAPEVNGAGLSLSLSTSSLFADGFFQMRSSIPFNYLMVKQKGALKGNTLTTASGNSSNEDSVFRQFGVGTIDGVGGYRDQYLTLYSQSEDGQNYYTYNIKVPASRRNGYVLVLEEDYRYTASGLVDDWYNASSPLYKVVMDHDENGNESVRLEGTEEYIFSDETTRFLSPALLPGIYAFDVPLENGSFRLVMFRIEDLDERGGVIMMDSVHPLEPLDLNEVYTEFVMFDNTRVVTMDEYWDILYPPVEDDFYFGDGFSDEDFFGDDDFFTEDDEWDDTSEADPDSIYITEDTDGSLTYTELLSEDPYGGDGEKEGSVSIPSGEMDGSIMRDNEEPAPSEGQAD